LGQLVRIVASFRDLFVVERPKTRFAGCVIRGYLGVMDARHSQEQCNYNARAILASVAMHQNAAFLSVGNCAQDGGYLGLEML
jgi:hypothetical protein